MSNYKAGDKYIVKKIWHKDLLIVTDQCLKEAYWNERIIRKAYWIEIIFNRRLFK